MSTHLCINTSLQHFPATCNKFHKTRAEERESKEGPQKNENSNEPLKLEILASRNQKKKFLENFSSIENTTK